MAVTAVSGLAAGCTVLCPATTALAQPLAPAAAPAPTAPTAPTAPPPAEDAANDGEKDIRTVTDGDTLWSMAEEIYGSGAKWPDLYRANQDGIAKAARAHGFPSDGNGHRIFAGTAVHAPASPTARAATPGRADPHVARFQRQVARSGYVSQSGSEAVFDMSRRYCEGALFSGMWPNPSRPTSSPTCPRYRDRRPTPTRPSPGVCARTRPSS